MSSPVFSLAAALVLAAASPALAAGGDGDPDAAAGHDDMHDVPVVRVLAIETGARVQRGVTLYLNRDGGMVTGGWDDAARGVSSVAMGEGDVRIPAYRGGDRRWRQVVACVEDRFRPFAVDVVTARPATAGYSMIMVGGEPGLFGYPDSVGGVAPYNGEVMRGAIGYVFSDNLGDDVESTCTSIVHEAGHTFGLDHAYVCEDPMSYLWGCGEKRFQDVDAACGEGEARACATGEPTQNSYRHLARVLGLRDGGRAEPDVPAPREPEPEPEPEAPADDADGADGWDDADAGWDDADWGGWDDEPTADDDDADTTAPEVRILGRADALPGNQWTEIVVRASDDDDLTDVELGWASETMELVISCASPPDDMPVSCTRDGDKFRFQLLVGVGLRGMVARATDHAGNQTVTDVRLVFFEE